MTDAPTGLFDGMTPQPPDPLLALIADFAADPRPGKIDLGVGVFRDETGATPILATVKAAERLLVAQQTSKSYLGPEGDPVYVELLKPIVFGESPARDERIVGLQTPGGTGALRLAADAIAAAAPGTRIWLGQPTWPNHAPIFSASRLAIETYRHFDAAAQRVLFDDAVAAFSRAAAGDVVVLHGCCHNPAGADFTRAQWTVLADLIGKRGLVPLIDFAYHGLGQGFEEDRAGLEIVLSRASEAVIAYSCDKNFGLYRDRVGALFVRGKDGTAARTIYSNLLAIARANWSMPPDHGGAVVRTVLSSPELAAQWRGEVDAMRARIVAIREALADAAPFLRPLREQRGMFSLLPLAREAVAQLRSEHAIYMAPSGRINIAGLKRSDVPRFVAALAPHLG